MLIIELLNFNSLYHQQQQEIDENRVETPKGPAIVSIFTPDEQTGSTNNFNSSESNPTADNSMLSRPQLDGKPTVSSGFRIPTLFTSKSLSTLNLNQPSNSNSSKANNEQLQQPHTAPEQTTGITLARPSSKTLIHSLVPKQVASSCGHHNAGQELCYLCHQRMRRNVPIYLHEENRQKELEENQLLMQYQSLKDLDKQLKDEEKKNIQRSFLFF